MREIISPDAIDLAPARPSKSGRRAAQDASNRHAERLARDIKQAQRETRIAGRIARGEDRRQTQELDRIEALRGGVLVAANGARIIVKDSRDAAWIRRVLDR